MRALTNSCGLLIAALAASVAFPRTARSDDWSSHGLDLSHGRLSAERSGAAFRGARWSFALPADTASVSSPAVADGYAVFGAFDGIVRAIGATDGKLRWQLKLGDGVYAAPAIHRGKVFVPSLDRKLYALRLADGTLAWLRDLGGLELASPVVVDGAVIVAAGFPQRKIFKIDAATGNTLWESPPGVLAQFSNSAAAVAADQVIIGANGGHYYSFDLATGALRWTYAADGIVNLSAPVVSDGRAYMLPGGSSRKLHGVDISTGQALDGWPIELPTANPDIAGNLLSRQHAVSSLAAADGRILFNLRLDDMIDTNSDRIPDRYLLREYVMAVDAESATVLWQQPNGHAVVTDENEMPKFWLCPTPALYRTASSGALVAVSSSIASTLRVLDPATGVERWITGTAGPTQISPVVANGRLFLGSNRALLGLLSSVNRPPGVPFLLGGNGRQVTNVAPTLRWSAAMDPDGDAVSYQVRIDRDREILETWQREITTTPGQTSLRFPGPLEAGVTYTLSVRARDSKGAWSDWAAPETLVATDTPPVSIDGQPQSDVVSALQNARPGSIIALGAGIFKLSETLRVPGGVTLSGAGPSRTILDASGLSVGIALEGSQPGQPTQVTRLTVANAVVGIAVRDTRDALLKNVILRDNTEAGVEVDISSSAQLINGTLVRNKNGVMSYGSILVKNSVLTLSHTAFWSESPQAITSRFNNVYGNTTDYRSIERGFGDLTAEIGWVDMNSNDFHVLAAQPSTDRGDPADDFSQEPMPNGDRVNLGAFGGTDEAELSAVVEPTPPTQTRDGGTADAAPSAVVEPTPPPGSSDGGTAEPEPSPGDIPAPMTMAGPKHSGGCSVAARAGNRPGATKLGWLILLPLSGLALRRRRR